MVPVTGLGSILTQINVLTMITSMRFLLFYTHQLPPMSQLDSDAAFQVTLDSTPASFPSLWKLGEPQREKDDLVPGSSE